MVANYNNTLHLIVTLPESVMKTQTRSSRASNIFSTPLHDSGGLEAAGRSRRSKSREDLLMAEIDDLYGYVRDGGAPPITKFQYDSDEESYWEEPAYEPLDQFRARLKAIESGQQVSFPAHYRPADPTQLRGLVGGGGGGGGPAGPPPPPPPAVMVSGDAVGVGEQGVVVTSEGVGGVMSNGRVSGELPSADTDLPPPLPPRPSEIASAAAAAVAVAVNATAAPSSSTPADSSWKPPVPSKTAIQPSQSRRVSAPPAPPPAAARASVNSNSTGANRDSSSGTKSATSSNRDSSTGEAHGVPPRRVSRSDSEPSIAIPSSAAAARPTAAAHRLQNQGEAKLDWKERLRRFDAMQDKDKEGSSSASSGSGQKKAGIRLARDFKDSDISSRTKASSGSSGGRGARKRMQTLYL